jgi:flagellar export protein FliJ
MFQFRLQRVLDYRRLRVEHLEEETRQRQRTLQHAESLLETLQLESQRQQELLSASQGEALVGEQLRMWRRYYQELNTRITAQQSIVMDAAKALGEKRQELIEARQAQKMLEKLAERAHKSYVLTLRQREQGLLDEIASARSRYGY